MQQYVYSSTPGAQAFPTALAAASVHPMFAGSVREIVSRGGAVTFFGSARNGMEIEFSSEDGERHTVKSNPSRPEASLRKIIIGKMERGSVQTPAAIN